MKSRSAIARDRLGSAHPCDERLMLTSITQEAHQPLGAAEYIFESGKSILISVLAQDSNVLSQPFVCITSFLD